MNTQLRLESLATDFIFLLDVNEGNSIGFLSGQLFGSLLPEADGSRSKIPDPG